MYDIYYTGTNWPEEAKALLRIKELADPGFSQRIHMVKTASMVAAPT